MEKSKDPLSTDRLELWYAHSFGVKAGYVSSHLSDSAIWLSLLAKRAKDFSGSYHPSVQAMADFLNNPVNVKLKKQVQEMIKVGLIVHQKFEPDTKYSIENIDDMLDALNVIISEPPQYNPNVPHSAFPMSGLFVYMMWSRAGEIVFQDTGFNDHLRSILKAWCKYLDSEESRYVLNTKEPRQNHQGEWQPGGWLCGSAINAYSLKECENYKFFGEDYWRFTSYNDFFHRQVQSRLRPIAGSGVDSVVTSANDGTALNIVDDVQADTKINLKNQTYSLRQILNNSAYVKEFVGGTVFQSFLSGNDYHRWWTPVSGTILHTEIVNGFMFYELYDEGFDPDAGVKSQVYEANVNTRGLVFIQTEHIGKVCVIPIGITEISSVQFHPDIKVGAKINKGDELGWFSYGGSSMAIIFQKDVIRKFAFDKPEPDAPDNPIIRVGTQIATANLSK